MALSSIARLTSVTILITKITFCCTMIHISQDMYIPFVSSQWLSSHSLSFTKCHSVSV